MIFDRSKPAHRTIAARLFSRKKLPIAAHSTSGAGKTGAARSHTHSYLGGDQRTHLAAPPRGACFAGPHEGADPCPIADRPGPLGQVSNSGQAGKLPVDSKIRRPFRAPQCPSRSSPPWPWSPPDWIPAPLDRRMRRFSAKNGRQPARIRIFARCRRRFQWSRGGPWRGVPGAVPALCACADPAAGSTAKTAAMASPKKDWTHIHTCDLVGA